MRVLVVHESMFGNTAEIAEAISTGVSTLPDVEAELVPVRRAPTDLHDVDLLVVGAPTHAFSLSRASTRADAKSKGGDELAADAIGVREWIEQLDPAGGPAVATFDTRVRRPRLPGSAARAARKRLRGRGLRAVEPPMTFWVDGTSGPLLAGEADRARRWGADLAAAVLEHRVTPS